MVNAAILNSIDAVWNPNACMAVNNNCIYLMLNNVCDLTCNVSACLYDLGSCSTCSNTLCASCIGNICIKCIAGYYSLMGDCIPYIPHSFTIYPSFPYFLIPETDLSTLENPKTLYVSPQKLSHIETGSLQNPYSSLSTALASISNKYTKIYLMNGHHYLAQVDLNVPELLFLNKSTLPLSTKWVYKLINITTLMCNEMNVFGCANNSAIILYMDTQVKLTVEYSAILEINNVIFDGSYSLNNNCMNELCYYCPYYEEINGINYNDKNQPMDVDIISKNCESNSQSTFINFSQGGTLLLNNVTFHEFRQQFKAVLDISQTYAVFVNVSFIYAQASNTSAVIIQNGGSLNWILGMIEYVNYGYEYLDQINLGSFLMISNSNSFHMQYVITQWNTAFNSNIIIIQNCQMVVIEECLFNYNWANNVVYINTINNEQLAHILIRNTSFTNNLSKFGSILAIESLKDIRTIYIENCQFTYNYLANGSGILSLISYGNSIIYSSNILLQNINFSENQGGGTLCINIKGLSQIVFSGILINPFTNLNLYPSENYINASIINGLYMKKPGNISFSQCSNIISIENILHIANFTNFKMQGQTCQNIMNLLNNSAVNFI